jgi:aspartyl-tRNA(Asn)/glutamyl-tRNA(Gln) amidotransferase subunit A
VAKRYRRGDVSPVEITHSLLARIEQENPSLNAFISVWRDAALRAARLAEQELRDDVDRGALHGIPVAIKDLIETNDHPTTYGSRVVPPQRPNADAWIVSRLKRAGAVILGKTNLLEFAYGIVHPEFGQTNNPWDTSRTAGGSSGGSAAAVAAGMCFAAIGTDTGGSIRIPAAYCGVVGLKPTFDRLPTDGAFPLSPSLDHVGPITQSVNDMEQVWSALCGDHTPFEPPADTLRLGVLSRYIGSTDMEPGVSDVIEDALATLRSSGVQLERVDLASLQDCDEHLINVVLPEASDVHQALYKDQATHYADGTRTQIAQGFDIPAVAYLRAQRYRAELTSDIDNLLRDHDALILPTAPWVAPAEDPAIATQSGDAEGRRTAPFNMTGHPAITINAGFVGGLPVGLQVVTERYRDAQAIAIAREIEQRLGTSPIRRLRRLS